MAKLTKDELIEQFKEMTLIELSEFLKEFEEVFDVTAAAPVAVAAAGAPAAGGEAAAEEKDEFDVVLENAGDKKIGVIKVVRELVPGLGLKDGPVSAQLCKAGFEATEVVVGLGGGRRWVGGVPPRPGFGEAGG